jgi:hypothetical protein
MTTWKQLQETIEAPEIDYEARAKSLGRGFAFHELFTLDDMRVLMHAVEIMHGFSAAALMKGDVTRARQAMAVSSELGAMVLSLGSSKGLIEAPTKRRT